MEKNTKTQKELLLEIEALQAQLKKADNILQVISNGAADKPDAAGKQGGQIFFSQNAEQTYSTLLGLMNDGAVIVSDKRLILFCNKRFSAFIQMPGEKILGSNLLDYFSKTDRFAVDKLLAQTAPETAAAEVMLRAEDGSYVLARLSLAKVVSDDSSVTCLVFTNLSERTKESRSAREQLSMVESKYKSLVEQIPAVTYMAALDEAGTPLYVSPQIETVLGFSPHEWLSDPESWVKQIHPEDRGRVLAEYKSSHENRRPFRAEYRWLTRDGRTLWCYDTAVLVKDKTGKPLFFQGIAADITHFKQATGEIHLLQSLTVAVSLSGNLHDALVAAMQQICNHTGWAYGEAWMLSQDGAFLERDHAFYSSMEVFDAFSKHTEGMTFSAGEGLPGRAWAEKQPVMILDVTRDGQYVRSAVAGDVGFKTGIAFPIIADGEVVSVIVFYSLREEKQSDHLIKLISSVLSQISSIIKRARAEELLRESEERLRTILDNATAVVYIKDIQGRYTFINRQFETLFHVKRDEVRGKTPYDCFPKEIAAAHLENDRKVFESGVPMQFDEKASLEDGIHSYLSVKFPLFALDGTVSAVCGISTDITDRKKLEEEREKLREQLYRSQNLASIGKLAGGVAHNFNNLLTVIMGFASLLDMEIEENSPFREYTRKIIKSSQTAADVTQALLAFSRKQFVSPKPVNINEIIRQSEPLLSKLARDDITLTMTLTDADTIVMADVGQIGQVLMNLATNARDAMPDGGNLKICTEVMEMDDAFIKLHGYGVAGKYVHIAVSDTGIGMEENTKLRVFEPFFTTKEVGKGTGLGLSSVYGIVKQHSGYINVDSEPGKGATFNVYLPLTESGAERKEGATRPMFARGCAETVLLAEDDPVVRELVRMVFEHAGYRVIEAVDGEDAIVKFMEHKDSVKLLVSDLIIPKKNGREAYEAMRAVRADVKALFITGYDDSVISKVGIQKGKFDYLVKPVSPAELLEKVREVLAKP